METYEDWYANWQTKTDDEKKDFIAEICQFSMKDLKKRFFKNFGCITSVSDEHELELARAFHEFHKHFNPELHDLREFKNQHGYHVTTCKCGFEEYCK